MAKDTTSTPQTKPAKVSSPAGARKVAPRRGATNEALARRTGVPSLGTFFRESYAELHKVTWPTRQEAMNLTLAVVAMTVAIAIFLGIIDALLDVLVKRLIGA